MDSPVWPAGPSDRLAVASVVLDHLPLSLYERDAGVLEANGNIPARQYAEGGRTQVGAWSIWVHRHDESELSDKLHWHISGTATAMHSGHLRYFMFGNMK